MNVWFHSNNNDWEDGVILYLKENNVWQNVYNTNWTKKNNIDAVDNYLQDIKPEYTKLLDRSLFEGLYHHLYKFIDMHSRNSKLDQNSYHDFTIHEYLNLFNLILQYYYYQYTSKNINLVFFNRAPHVGFDYLSYVLAQEMGIKTLILEQTPFPNRFFYYWKHEDFGTFNTSKIKFEHPYVEVETKFEKELVYMKNISKNKIRNVGDLYTQYPLIKLIRELFDQDLRAGALSKYYKNKRFNINNTRYETAESSIDFQTPYIYFGLHLQPEKTTSSWGGIYTDQLLALEHLSNQLPEGWKIYVKENPKQGYYMRDEYFYQRLNKIPNTILVDSQINTYKLLKNCKIAATITGTIGWESITGGKPAIYFGWGTWYKTFPGVYEFNDDIDINKIMADFKPLPQKEIENKLNHLLDYTGKGVIYNKGWYKDIVEEYSQEKNITHIAQSLENILIADV